MSKGIRTAKSVIAITLCILTVLLSVCSLVRITDIECENTQFFAVNFSLEFAPVQRESFSKHANERIVSWIKKQEIDFENIFFLSEFSLFGEFFGDKQSPSKFFVKTDLFDDIKKTNFFMRI